jgi:hypothetical protein
MNDNNNNDLNLEKKKIELQKLRIENMSLLGDVIKKFIEDFGKLIAIIGIILTMLGNAGLITYNAMASNNKEKILDVPELSMSMLSPSVEKILPIATISHPNINNDGNNNRFNRSGPSYLMRKIKHEIFNINNIILLIFTIMFVIPLLKKKINKKESGTDASTNINTNKK